MRPAPCDPRTTPSDHLSVARLARSCGASQPRTTASGGVGQLVLGVRRAGGAEGGFDAASDRLDRLRVFSDGVRRAVFAPAGDVGDGLAADVEADRAADDVARAVD